MTDKVFSVTGNKISSFITDENSLKFSSARFDTVQSFQEAFAKKLSLSTKVEIKYDSIKSIRKEDNEKEIVIKYKTFAGIPADCAFSFTDASDYETFFAFIEKERYFIRISETLAPFSAIRNYAIGLLITIGITVLAYYEAVGMANGTVEEAHYGRARLFQFIVNLLGDKGVLAVGALIACYLVYKIWLRYSNPPTQIRFIPPNT